MVGLEIILSTFIGTEIIMKLVISLDHIFRNSFNL
jgi:hypothetical protein